MGKMKFQKDNIENKSLRVKIGKTKVMICEEDLDIMKPSGKDP